MSSFLNSGIHKREPLVKTQIFVKGLVDTDDAEHYAAYLTPEGFEISQS
jgi:hypothetical protein